MSEARDHVSSKDPCPEWVKVRAVVKVIKDPFLPTVIKERTKVRAKPWRMKKRWVTKVEGISGAVSVGCLEVLS